MGVPSRCLPLATGKGSNNEQPPRGAAWTSTILDECSDLLLDGLSFGLFGPTEPIAPRQGAVHGVVIPCYQWVTWGESNPPSAAPAMLL